MSWLKSPPVWIGMCILVAAVILRLLPHSTEVTMHLVTKTLAFSLPDSASTQPLIQGVSLTSLTLHGVPALALEVEALHQQGRPIAMAGARIVLRAQQPSEYTLRSSPHGELRLVRLDLAGTSEVQLQAAAEGQLQMDVRSPQMGRLELAFVDRRFELVMPDGVTLLDEQNRAIPLRPGSTPHILEVTPASSRLVLEPPMEVRFGLDMHLSAQENAGDMADLSPAFGRLRLTGVAFPQIKTRHTPREAVIKKFWGEPLVPHDKPKTHVVVKLQENDIFTLQGLQVSAEGLVCELVGTTHKVHAGKESPHENLVPSWLEYLVKDVFFQTLCKLAGLC